MKPKLVRSILSPNLIADGKKNRTKQDKHRKQSKNSSDFSSNPSVSSSGSSRSSGSDKEADLFDRGDKVEARFNGKEKWYKGEVTRRRSDGTYDIEYEDGDREMRVKAEFVRSADKKRNEKKQKKGTKKKKKNEQSKTSSSSSGSGSDKEADLFDRGDKVEARFNGKEKWYKGEVTRRRSDGTYDIEYEDGDREMQVKAEFVRSADKKRNEKKQKKGTKKKKKKQQSKTSSSSSGSGSDKEADLFDRGDKVEARFNGKEKWYKGEVTRRRSDGTYDIEYEDGDREMRVKAEFVRSADKKRNEKKQKKGTKKKKKNEQSKTSSSSSGSGSDKEADLFDRGDKVEARFNGKEKWYKGEVTRRRSDGTYDIEYEDGDREMRVKAEFVRSADKKRNEKKQKKGTKKKKKNEQSKTSSSSSGSGSDKEADLFDRGDKVEARFNGKEKWYKGEVTRRRSDGTYDIEYEDGDREMRVKAEFVRSADKKRNEKKQKKGTKKKKKNEQSKTSSSSSGSGSDKEADLFDRGDKVEARFNGKEKWYKGEVTRRRSDGTYDIEYEDGDREMRVKAEFVRSADKKRNEKKQKKGTKKKKKKQQSKTSSSSSGSGSDKEADLFDRGDKVEARFNGKEKWYKGEVTRRRSDGTYDIEYEDGDREIRVKAEFVRSADKKRIAKKQKKGTKKKKKNEQSKTSSSSSGSGSDKEADVFDRGDKVEARFNGKEKWYKGEVTRRRSDGTYDIEYEDGDREMRVKAEFVRSADKKRIAKKQKKGKKKKNEQRFMLSTSTSPSSSASDSDKRQARPKHPKVQAIKTKAPAGASNVARDSGGEVITKKVVERWGAIYDHFVDAQEGCMTTETMRNYLKLCFG